MVFRGQSIDPPAQMTFARRWGKVLDAPYLKPIEMPGQPGMLVLPNLGKERSYATEVWHTDLSFMPAPPALDDARGAGGTGGGWRYHVRQPVPGL